jgi:hypothetical protein
VCSSLTSVTIPPGVTTIENGAFNGCGNLTKITFAPESQLKRIQSFAFLRCSSLKSIDIPPDVEEIAFSSFLGCSSLTSITIPSSVTEIGSNAFAECTELKRISIGPNIDPEPKKWGITRDELCDFFTTGEKK